jgi:hypothetical protein
MSGYERLYETHYADCAVRVMQQALMSVLIIVQMTHEAVRRLTVVEQVFVQKMAGRTPLDMSILDMHNAFIKYKYMYVCMYI